MSGGIFNLVMAGPMGLPMESPAIERALNHLIEENDLPKVRFLNLRHPSIAYKLKLNVGDIYAVQRDSGYAQARMETTQYSHILADSRAENVRLIEDAFYADRRAAAPAESKKPPQDTDGNPLI